MAQVKIVTDSNAYLPQPDLIAQLGIEVIPLTVRVPGSNYPERINLTDEAFLRQAWPRTPRASRSTPTVRRSGPQFSAAEPQTTDRSSASTCPARSSMSPRSPARLPAGFMGRQRIVVLDTATTSVGLGLIVEAAARAAADGAPQSAQVVRIVRGMIPHMYALFFSDSLEYLEAWGRLGTGPDHLGHHAGLKPLSTMEDGDLLPIEKVRNYRREPSISSTTSSSSSRDRADVPLAARLRERSRAASGTAGSLAYPPRVPGDRLPPRWQSISALRRWV